LGIFYEGRSRSKAFGAACLFYPCAVEKLTAMVERVVFMVIAKKQGSLCTKKQEISSLK
jgi:hypothetical protein